MRIGGPLWVTLISARLPEPTELQTQEVPLAMPRTPLPPWVSLFYLISFRPGLCTGQRHRTVAPSGV